MFILILVIILKNLFISLYILALNKAMLWVTFDAFVIAKNSRKSIKNSILLYSLALYICLSFLKQQCLNLINVTFSYASVWNLKSIGVIFSLLYIHLPIFSQLSNFDLFRISFSYKRQKIYPVYCLLLETFKTAK